MPTDKRARQKEGRALRQAEIHRWEARRRTRRRLILFGGGAVVFFGLFWFLSGKGGDDEQATATSTTVAANTIDGPTECPPAAGVDEPVTGFSEPPPDCLDPGKGYTAIFDTTEGEIRVDLDTERTPDTVNNFVVLSRYGYYDGTPIFRTDPSIGIIQGGAPDPSADPGYTIPDEGDGFTYEPGQLVMARTQAPDSASSQFFFVANDRASSLDVQGTYVVFGRTDEAGLQVVRDILALHDPESTDPLGGPPDPAVTINSVTIRERPAG